MNVPTASASTGITGFVTCTDQLNVEGESLVGLVKVCVHGRFEGPIAAACPSSPLHTS